MNFNSKKVLIYENSKDKNNMDKNNMDKNKGHLAPDQLLLVYLLGVIKQGASPLHTLCLDSLPHKDVPLNARRTPRKNQGHIYAAPLVRRD